MLDKIKLFYAEHKMYVNIAIGAIAVFGIWKLAKKK
jgi:hypothetical protein